MFRKRKRWMSVVRPGILAIDMNIKPNLTSSQLFQKGTRWRSIIRPSRRDAIPSQTGPSCGKAVTRCSEITGMARALLQKGDFHIVVDTERGAMNFTTLVRDMFLACEFGPGLLFGGGGKGENSIKLQPQRTGHLLSGCRTVAALEKGTPGPVHSCCQCTVLRDYPCMMLPCCQRFFCKEARYGVGVVAFRSFSRVSRAPFLLSRDNPSFCPTTRQSTLLLFKEVVPRDCSQLRQHLKPITCTLEAERELLCLLGQTRLRRCAPGLFTMEDEGVEVLGKPSQGSLVFELEKGFYSMGPVRSSSPAVAAAVAEPATELANRFWEGSQKDAYCALYHPFVVALATGSLDISAFERYIAQDIYFLGAFAEAYGLAIEGTDDPEANAALQGLVAGVQDELNQVHSSVVSLGTAVTAIRPNPATSAYTDFLLGVARGNDDDVELEAKKGGCSNGIAALLLRRRRTAYTLAAMTPCNRLYAFLGQEIKKAFKGDTRSSAYGQWIDTYASSEFQSTAIRSEQLVHRLAVPFPGEIDVAAMERLYRRAMELEVAFFAAQEQPPLSTKGRPVFVPLLLSGLASNSHFVLVSDFDSTCTVSDSCPVLADLSVATREREGATGGVAILSAESLRSRWDSLVDLYSQGYTELLDRFLSNEELSSLGSQQVRAYNPGTARKVLEALAEFEIAANKRVVESSVLSGLSVEDLKQAGGSIPLREGCSALLKRICGDKLPIDFHVLSVCWSRSIIEGSFLGNGLQFGNVHSNELEFNDKGVSSGNMLRRVQTAVDKENRFMDIVDRTKETLEGSLSSKSPFTVYVGDSLTDLLCLLRADIGIVIGESSSLKRVAKAAGITLLPLYSGLLQQQESASQLNSWTKVDGVLYRISNWNELHAFLLGS